MANQITIAVDAMGGDNSPKKVIEGIKLHSKDAKDIYYKIFGNKNLIQQIIKETKLNLNIFEIIHTEDKVEPKEFLNIHFLSFYLKFCLFLGFHISLHSL